MCTPKFRPLLFALSAAVALASPAGAAPQAYLDAASARRPRHGSLADDATVTWTLGMANRLLLDAPPWRTTRLSRGQLAWTAMC